MIFSCHTKENIRINKTKFEFYPSDSSLFQYKLHLPFNLPSLLDGSQDSIEIRVCPYDYVGLSKDFLVFKRDSNNWKGYFYFSYSIPIIDQNGIYFTLIDKKNIGDSIFLVKQITPLCGWDKFSDSLAYFKLKDLPTQLLIKDFKPVDIQDGDAVNIELATPHSYRYLSYSNPTSYSYKECRSVTGFLEMLKRQFDFNWGKSLMK
jgi:hypothetical protein